MYPVSMRRLSQDLDQVVGAGFGFFDGKAPGQLNSRLQSVHKAVGVDATVVRHVVAGEWRTLVSGVETATDGVKSQSYIQVGQGFDIQSLYLDRNLLPAFEATGKQAIGVDPKFGPRLDWHDTPGQLRRIESPKIVVPPKIDPILRRGRDAIADATDFLDGRFEPFGARRRLLREITYQCWIQSNFGVRSFFSTTATLRSMN